MTKLNKVVCLESVYGLGENIDRDKGIAYGVKVIQMGRVNDARPFKVDEETLDQVTDLGNRPNKGVKVRLTHPQGDGIGSHLGRASNFYIDGDCVRADLTVAKSAEYSPMGNMWEYFFSMAEEDPEAIGMSIAAVLDGSDMEYDEDGYAYLRVTKLHAVDVVGDPAATRGGLFHQEDSGMSEELKEEIVEDTQELGQEEVKVEAVEEVVEEVKEEVQEEVKEEVKDETPEPQPEPEVEEVKEEQPEPVAIQQGTDGEPAPVTETRTLGSDHEAYTEAFGDIGARWYLEGKSLEDCFAQRCGEQAEEIESLKGQLEELSAKLEAIGENFGEEAPAQQSVELSTEEVAAAAKQEKFDSLKGNGWNGAVAGMSSILNG